MTTYNNCTVSAIKPAIQSLAMKAGDSVDDSAITKTCSLLKKEGPIMGCAKENLGKCFETQDLEFNLKLGGQHATLLPMECYSEDQMVVENDIFFAWLELEGIYADKNESSCTEEAVDKTNIHFQECILHQDESLIEDTKNKKKAKKTATNSFMKCFDETENLCFSEREITFLRKEFLDSVEDMMTVIFGMGDLNMNEDKEEEVDPLGTVKDVQGTQQNNSNSLMSTFVMLFSALFMVL